MRILWRAQLDVVVRAHTPEQARRKLRLAVQRSESLTAAGALRENLFRLIGSFDITRVRPGERELAQPIIDVFSGLRLFASTYDGRHAAIIGHVRTMPSGNPGVRPICLMLDERQLPRLGAMYEDSGDEEDPEPESRTESEPKQKQLRLWEETDE